MKEVRYAVVGAGNQGTYYALKLANGEVPASRLTAIAEVNPVKTEAIKAKLPDGILYYTDYKKMLDDKVCDAVLVVVPHYSHPEIVIECLHRGVHVITDKPAAVYTKQVEEMNAAARKSHALYGMMFNQRTNCLYRKMKEIISSGGIGSLQRVNWIITDWYRTQNYYDSGSWRATWKGEGGGVLINQCPHQLDLVQWVVGEMPVSVRGFCKYGKWHDVEVEDEVTAYFDYKNGASGVFITTTGEAPGTNRFEVSGTGGKLLCENGKLFYYKNAEDSADYCRTSKESFSKPKCEIFEPETDGQNPQHVGILTNFTRAILGEEKLFVDGKEGINGVELMNAIELSGWNDGEKITLPIDGKKYYDALMEHVAVSRYKEGNDSVVEGTLNFGTGSENVKSVK
ncbi:MAG: Gfo/Idh/MocA family oxidoreductase [Clostridia bacterium]|nr:Gfo/Idh/MocA family oxidoreductase [Clostridia bacterium]